MAKLLAGQRVKAETAGEPKGSLESFSGKEYRSDNWAKGSAVSLAGFLETFFGRFWVTPEDQEATTAWILLVL